MSSFSIDVNNSSQHIFHQPIKVTTNNLYFNVTPNYTTLYRTDNNMEMLSFSQGLAIGKADFFGRNHEPINEGTLSNFQNYIIFRCDEDGGVNNPPGIYVNKDNPNVEYSIKGFHLYDHNNQLVTASSGGVTDYDDLTDKPSINGVSLSGNKTSTELGIIGTIDFPNITLPPYDFYDWGEKQSIDIEYNTDVYTFDIRFLGPDPTPSDPDPYPTASDWSSSDFEYAGALFAHNENGIMIKYDGDNYANTSYGKHIFVSPEGIKGFYAKYENIALTDKPIFSTFQIYDCDLTGCTITGSSISNCGINNYIFSIKCTFNTKRGFRIRSYL